MMFNFYSYMEEFERRVIIKGIEIGSLGKKEQVSVRNGSLSKSRFGRVVGRRMPYREVCVLDYYGLMKKTDGFFDLLAEVKKDFYGKQVKSLTVDVVHFATVHFEKVVKLAPDLAVGFLEFKKTLLTLRGFSHTYGEV